MCGILGVFGSTLNEVELRAKLIEASRHLRHRGPDWSGYVVRIFDHLSQ
jgi:asparagine synthase (glutamine-hydrolysing)